MKSLLTTYETVYKVEGMTCQACADTIETGVKTNLGVLLAHVSLEKKELRIQSDTIFDINNINSVVKNLGDYRIRDNNPGLISNIVEYFVSKKPIVIALSLVTISSLALQVPTNTFDINKWFITYMGLFFMLFSFLKLLNVSGFSMTFKKYDLISKKIPVFSTIYPYIELTLAIAFLTESLLMYAMIFTLIFMISQSIGVYKSLRSSEQIQCACMGSAISLPLSSLTLIENIIMISMATYMIQAYF
mgnify:FL=1|tara:strand:- start:3116 stop:3853 length:738 start_codon:yes stop_codon:yes gene_type:complete